MENPKMEWVVKSGKECLKSTFTGNFTEQNARTAADKLREAFNSRPTGRIILIWDCLEMNDYDHEARTIWQNLCKEYKDRIETIWVMTNSILIRMGASVISVFTSLKIKVVANENEIKI